MKITEQQMSNLRSTLFQALGHASLCWRPAPHGVFDGKQALEVGEVLFSDIVKLLELEVEQPCVTNPEGLRFEYINPNLPIEKPRVLKALRFEYLIPEFARPDFKLPEEEPIEKGNKPMDEELFTEEAIKRLTEPEGGCPQEPRALRVPGRGHRDLHQPRPEVADVGLRG